MRACALIGYASRVSTRRPEREAGTAPLAQYAVSLNEKAAAKRAVAAAKEVVIGSDVAGDANLDVAVADEDAEVRIPLQTACPHHHSWVYQSGICAAYSANPLPTPLPCPRGACDETSTALLSQRSLRVR